MFGWFTSKCPVDAGMKRWIEARTGWLLGQFGKKQILHAPMILPNKEFFPDPYDGSEESGRSLFERTCHYMNFDAARVELKFYRPRRKGRFNASLVQPRPGWAGLYDANVETQKTIWVDCELLEDAEGLVATFSHELSHAILLGDKRLSQDAPDMEQLTDLATVVLGMGIFNANVSFRTKNYTATRMHFSSISWIGYLAPESFGYALALFAWLREEDNPAWTQYLNTPVCDPCKQGLAYLRKTCDAAVVEGESFDSISWHELFPSNASDSQTPTKNDMIFDAEAKAAEESETEADRHFTDGYNFAENGQWKEAEESYSKIIEVNPQDGEAHQERAWAYLELGRIAEAVSDAEKAVELLPEESEAFFVRGTAYSQSKRYDRAISDLNRYLDEEDCLAHNGTYSSKAFYFRGLAYAGQKDFKCAVRDFTKAIIRWPNWPDPYEARGLAYEQLGDVKKARADRDEAVRRAAM
jgi:tetratricopeptide (TPR) repeat protein